MISAATSSFRRASKSTNWSSSCSARTAAYAKRANKIYFKDRFVKYPFENGLGVLDKEDIYNCLIGYLKRDEYPEPKNLREWCYRRFGKGLAETYLIPYNEKIWNLATDQMSLEWVDRIPSPPLEDIVKSALGYETEGYLHQLYFKYPKKGGVEALVNAVRKPDGAVSCGFRVESIRRQGSGWSVNGSGGKRDYDRIVVAFPIHDAIRCFEGVPDEVENAVAVAPIQHDQHRVHRRQRRIAHGIERGLYPLDQCRDPSIVLHGVFQQGAGQARHLFADRGDHHQPRRRHP